MSDEDKYRGVPQNALHLNEKSSRRQQGDADEKAAARKGTGSGGPKDERPESERAEQSTERGGTGPNESVNKV